MSNISYLHDVHPDGAAMASTRERAVLDALAEGIIVLSGGEAGGVGDEVSFFVTFANKRAAGQFHIGEVGCVRVVAGRVSRLQRLFRDVRNCAGVVALLLHAA